MKSTLLLSLLLPSIASARIGETPEQCAARYGERGEHLQTKTYARSSFSKGGIDTVCYFVSGVCTSIIYQTGSPARVGTVEETKSPLFTHEQVMKLLEANSGGVKWKKTSETGWLIAQETDDGKLRANSTGYSVTIQTVADIERRKAMLTPEAIGKALEGF